MTATVANQSSTRPAIAAILVISLAATLFLFWLIYVHPAAATSAQYAFLPALNAALNGLSAIALVIGYTFIRSRNIKAHRASMITAFCFSTLFLVSYILHHALHGDVRYPAHAALRSVDDHPGIHSSTSHRLSVVRRVSQFFGFMGTSGRRYSSWINFIIASAAFTGVGLVSMNKSLNRG